MIQLQNNRLIYFVISTAKLILVTTEESDDSLSKIAFTIAVYDQFDLSLLNKIQLTALLLFKVKVIIVYSI
jgi:hypothetical protein